MNDTTDLQATMPRFGKWKPSQYDTPGLGSEGKEDWVLAMVLTRDSDALTRSNNRIIRAEVAKADPEGENHEIHRFGHWGPGWFEVIVCRPDTEAAYTLSRLVASIADYPVLSDEDFGGEEREEADQVWRDCYSYAERIEYIRERRSEFEFRSFSDLLGCVRGTYFAGSARVRAGHVFRGRRKRPSLRLEFRRPAREVSPRGSWSAFKRKENQ